MILGQLKQVEFVNLKIMMSKKWAEPEDLNKVRLYNKKYK